MRTVTHSQALIANYGSLWRLEGVTPSVRGQRFNRLIAEMLHSWGIEAKESVRSAGEIDVAFAVEGIRFVLEAKWEKKKADTGNLAKLQKRVRQRLTGTYGIFLSMAGYSDEALRDLADGDRLEVLLLEREHFEAMLAGLVPPTELLALARDHAAYYGRAHTSLSDLLCVKQQPPKFAFGGTPDMIEALSQPAQPGPEAEIAFAVPDSNQLGIACLSPDRLLVTTTSGIAEVDMTSRSARWVVPVSHCHRNAAAGVDGALYFVRGQGVGRYYDGQIQVVGGGLSDNSTLFSHPSGDVWAFCSDASDPSASAWTVRIGSNLEEQQVYELDRSHFSASSATWISPTMLATIGSSGLATAFGKRPIYHQPPQTKPTAIARLSDNLAATSGDSVSVGVTDLDTGDYRQLVHLHLRSSTSELATDPQGTWLYLASHYTTEETSKPFVVVRIGLVSKQGTPTRYLTSSQAHPQPALVHQHPPQPRLPVRNEQVGQVPYPAGKPATLPAAGQDAPRPRPVVGGVPETMSTKSPEPRTLTHVKCLLGHVSFDGQWITLTKDGVGALNKWQRRIHISEVTGVTLKPASRMFHGYIQFTVRGYAPTPAARWGASAGRPPFEDPDSMSFTRGTNEAISTLSRQIEAAIAAARS